MPFQGRLLMMEPLRLAENSAALQHWTHGRPGLSSPDLVVVELAGLLCMLVSGILVTRLYRRISTSGHLTYLPYLLLLALCAATYLQTFLYVYDLPSLAFFTAGLYCIYLRRFAALLVLFPVATLNRETTLFLIPLLAIDEIITADGWRWRRLLAPAPLAKLASLSVIWIALQVLVRHLYRTSPTELGLRIGKNIGWLLHPPFWPQILSTCGFLLPIVLLLGRRIEDRRLRAYLWIIPPWAAFMFVYAHLLEVRCYGELMGLVSLAAVLIFEGTFRIESRLPG